MHSLHQYLRELRARGRWITKHPKPLSLLGHWLTHPLRFVRDIRGVFFEVCGCGRWYLTTERMTDHWWTDCPIEAVRRRSALLEAIRRRSALHKPEMRNE